MQAFLLPVLRMALAGPRNVLGCDAALAVLNGYCLILGPERQQQ